MHISTKTGVLYIRVILCTIVYHILIRARCIVYSIPKGLVSGFLNFTTSSLLTSHFVTTSPRSSFYGRYSLPFYSAFRTVLGFTNESD